MYYYFAVFAVVWREWFFFVLCFIFCSLFCCVMTGILCWFCCFCCFQYFLCCCLFFNSLLLISLHWFGVLVEIISLCLMIFNLSLTSHYSMNVILSGRGAVAMGDHFSYFYVLKLSDKTFNLVFVSLLQIFNESPIHLLS